MGKRIFYVFGNLNSDGKPSIYDTTEIFDRYRFFICDTESDIPNCTDGDFAIVKSPQKFLCASGSTWIDTKGEKGNTGEPGSVKDAWPIDSVFQCVTDIDPEKLFGFGKWELIAKEPFYAWQRKE